MKQLFIIPLLLLAGASIAFAQKIRYEKTFEYAKNKSRSENKPLFVLISIRPPASVTNFLAGFEAPEVSSKFNSSFINYRTTREDTSAANPLIRKYKITRFPAFIFIDSKGGLLFKDFGNSSQSSKYLLMADRAINESKEKSLVQYDNEYALGNNDTAFLKEYILKRQKAGITNNAKLIDQFVDLLSVKDLEDYSQVLFILEAGPTADSKAYRLAYTNRKLVDSIYKTQPLERRTAINNTIIANSMADAIASKSVKKALATANFTRSTWTGDYTQGQKNYTLKLLQYYRAVNDTTNYLNQAGYFYDQYYMRISADSVKRMDEKKMENAKNAALKAAQARSANNGNAVQAISFRFAKNTFSTDLNNAAYSFYETGTKNQNHLIKAMLWSKRSIELDPKAAFYDTLAHLLYRLGFFTEAEATQEKAIELARSEKEDHKHLQEELEKIRKRTL